MTTKPVKGYRISQERLHTLLDYDQETGHFKWRPRAGDNCYVASWNTRYAGRKCLCVDNVNGYVVISIDDRRYRAHRLAWLYAYGIWPDHEIDHIDGNKTNNALVNLRAATRAENAQNKSAPRTNTSGAKGVCWDKRKKKWRVTITAGGHTLFVGHFSSVETAEKAYARAADHLHGQFANVGV